LERSSILAVVAVKDTYIASSEILVASADALTISAAVEFASMLKA